MKEVKVILIDKNTLIIDEDAKKGDHINLNSLANIDLTRIETLISEGKDQVYKNKLDELSKRHQEELYIKLNNQKLELEALFSTRLNSLNDERINAIKEKEMEIASLKQTIKDGLELSATKMDNLKLQIEKQYQDQIKDLKNQLDQEGLKNQVALQNLEQKHIIEVNQINDLHRHEIEQRNNSIKELENSISFLERNKSNKNVKLIGEDLEIWCNNQMNSYMQNGFFNCIWIKDTKSIQSEDEVKASKADYIFKIYASEEHLDSELLTSICLEMKDENPSSMNKKKNSDYYKALDNNRNKKNCRYAVLVSSLEQDNPNQDVIQRVIGYKDMYVVQPAYMVTFLNMITSLTTRFKDLILQSEREKQELISTFELQEEFEKLKETYLNSPLELLNKKISDIKKETDIIRKANDKIEEHCNKIISSYINSIIDKLNRFNINKLSKKLNKLND